MEVLLKDIQNLSYNHTDVMIKYLLVDFHSETFSHGLYEDNKPENAQWYE